MGYAGRCVASFLVGYADLVAAGAQLTFDHSDGQFTRTAGISAVFSEQQNIFEGQVHINTDDFVYRYWDDGRKTAPMIAWEAHDEGDMASNAATASWSAFGDNTWMSVDEVAQLLKKSVDEFTPEKFKQVYNDTWIKEHEFGAATENPNSQAELEIVEEVKNETDSADETMSPAEPGGAEENGGSSTDAAAPIEDDSAGNGRKLVSATARFVSAALRVFGI